MARLYLLNSIIVPFKDNEAVFYIAKLNKEDFVKKFKEAAATREVVSAIGHQATADYLSSILGYKVAVNRVEVFFDKYDIALVVRVKKRLAEGQVLEKLTDDDVEFYVIERRY